MTSLVASRIVAGRRRLGMTQRALAQSAGVSRQAIGAIESGRTQPSVAVGLAMARALDTSVERLFGGESEASLEVATTDATLARGQRVAVAAIGGHIAVRRLGAMHIGECAPAIVSSATGARAQLRALGTGPSLERTVFLTGCDVGFGLLARYVTATSKDVHGFWFPASNRDAIAALRNGQAHIAAVHGPDASPDRLARRLGKRTTLGKTVQLQFAAFEEGWLFGAGNPLSFRGARDLLRRGVRFVNRPVGSGARELLDAELCRLHVDPQKVPGYEHELSGHLDVSRAIAHGFVDVAVGIASAARIFGLGFLPLRRECCTLVMPRTALQHAGVAATIETLRTASYRHDLEALGPYDTNQIGEELS